jgi:hypothetical protein
LSKICNLNLQGCKEHIPYLAFIFSYNNIGKYINSIIKPIDLELTYRGLLLKNDQIFLSFNPDKIMEFIGMDAKKYKKGFQTNIQLNDWLSNHTLPKINNKEIINFFKE